jgi:tRNA modification GTPase
MEISRLRSGGVGIIRVSGPLSASIAENILGFLPSPRYAVFSKFLDHDNSIMDEGLALYFPGPHSYTGEDVLELQGHGGPVVLDRIFKRILALGAIVSKPGEFTERAFLNNKMDLTQAEAVADLIDASSSEAAKMALRSLQGEFSEKIRALVEETIKLRMYVEAAIDFPEEEIDFLADKKILHDLQVIQEKITKIKLSATQGVLMREGMTVVIAGKPNAGKSSLLNAMTGQESAIVTDIPGTTRDVLREYMHIDGMPLHIVDTAGLRETEDIIEKEGMRRAWQAIENADAILLMMDATLNISTDALVEDFKREAAEIGKHHLPIIVVKNKIDLKKELPLKRVEKNFTEISLSAKYKDGIDLLKQHLKELMGFQTTTEGAFLARRRHLDAIDRAEHFLNRAEKSLNENKAGELLAEDLRQVQNHLNEITGEFTSDDLLGKIFSSFCIGK